MIFNCRICGSYLLSKFIHNKIQVCEEALHPIDDENEEVKSEAKSEVKDPSEDPIKKQLGSMIQSLPLSLQQQTVIK